MAGDSEINEIQRLLSKSWDLLAEIKIGQVPKKSAADYLIESIRANMNNPNLTDTAFRVFIRSSVATIPKLGD